MFRERFLRIIGSMAYEIETVVQVNYCKIYTTFAHWEVDIVCVYIKMFLVSVLQLSSEQPSYEQRISSNQSFKL